MYIVLHQKKHDMIQRWRRATNDHGGWAKVRKPRKCEVSMKKKREEREAELKAELRRLKSQRKTLKEDMKKLKRELKDLKGSTRNSPLDDDDDREEN
jgi:seryl-tRNA synthetase